MRYFEIVLKLVFLVGSTFFIVTKNVYSNPYYIFLVFILLLGIVLIFNRDSSYKFTQKKKDLVMRRIEGIILIVFTVVSAMIMLGVSA